MEIKRADFVISLPAYRDFPGCGLPQIAVVGKSNVGKSSLINRLTRRSKLARTSATPGKTRLINVFLINEQFHLIDLPGYGFAKVDKQEKRQQAVRGLNHQAAYLLNPRVLSWMPSESLIHVRHLQQTPALNHQEPSFCSSSN